MVFRVRIEHERFRSTDGALVDNTHVTLDRRANPGGKGKCVAEVQSGTVGNLQEPSAELEGVTHPSSNRRELAEDQRMMVVAGGIEHPLAVYGIARPPGNEIGVLRYESRLGFCPGEDQLAELLGQKVSAFGERCPSARLAAGLLIAAHIESPDLVGCRWNGGNRVERDGGLDLPAVAHAFGRHFPGGVELPLQLAVHYPRAS